MKAYDLKARFNGNTVKGNVLNFLSVHCLNEAFSELAYKMIAIHLGRKHLAYELKEQVHIKAQIENDILEIRINFHENLFEWFEIYSPETPVVDFSDSIVGLLANAITLRYFVALAKASGKTSKIVLNTGELEKFRNIKRTKDGNIVLSHPKILWTAQMTKDEIDSIFSLLDQRNIDSFEVQSQSRTYCINPKLRIILDQQQSDLVAVVNFNGRLDKLFFSKQRGVVMGENENYQIAWDSSVKPKILNNIDRENVQFIAKPCIESHSHYGDLVVYKVLDCINSRHTSSYKQAAIR